MTQIVVGAIVSVTATAYVLWPLVRPARATACGRCGARLASPDARFCAACGAPIGRA